MPEPREEERRWERTIETLRCPVCGYTLRREEHPSAVHCGPHETGRPPPDQLSPAVRMVRVEDSHAD